jgi:hypothetical protein
VISISWIQPWVPLGNWKISPNARLNPSSETIFSENARAFFCVRAVTKYLRAHVNTITTRPWPPPGSARARGQIFGRMGQGGAGFAQGGAERGTLSGAGRCWQVQGWFSYAIFLREGVSACALCNLCNLLQSCATCATFCIVVQGSFIYAFFYPCAHASSTDISRRRGLWISLQPDLNRARGGIWVGFKWN